MRGGDWGQDVPVTGRGAPGFLIAVLSRLAPASQLSLPRLAVLTPRRSSRISATGPGTMRGRRAPGGCGRAEAFASLQSCAPDGGGAARAQPRSERAPLRRPPMGAVTVPRPAASRGGATGCPWETRLRLGRLTIAPPPAGQSEAADTGAGRSELGSSAPAGAR